MKHGKKCSCRLCKSVFQQGGQIAQNGYRYKNPFNVAQTVGENLMTTPFNYLNGYNMGKALGYTHKSSNHLGLMDVFNNNVLRGGANAIDNIRGNREYRQRGQDDYFDSFQNTTNYYDAYNPYTVGYKNGGQYKHGGKTNKIINHLAPIFDAHQPLKNSNGSDLASLWGRKTPDMPMYGYDTRNKTNGGNTFSTNHPRNKAAVNKDFSKAYYNKFNQNPKFNPYNNGGVHIDPLGYYSNPEANNYLVPTQGNITMKDVPEAMMGTSVETGEQKLMMPNKDYFFKNTKNVFEQKIKNFKPLRRFN